MRNAELPNPKDLNKRFIFRDPKLKSSSVFDFNLATERTLSAICSKIDSHSIPLDIYTEANLKVLFGNFYETMVWVARNKATASKTDFDSKINTCKSAYGTVAIDVILWDNLVYQVVTQKDFYAKEFIMQLLHLSHILNFYDGKDETYQNIINAKVVLPKELFKTDVGSAANGTTSRIVESSSNTLYNEKNMKFAEANFNLQANQVLTASLEKLAKAYQKEYQQSYNDAQARYQASIKPIQTEYQAQVSETENRKSIIENRIKYITDLSISDPELFARNTELKDELYKLKEELLGLYIPVPSLPEFSFTFRNEIDGTALESALNGENKAALNRIFETASLSEALKGISTFSELLQAVARNNQLLQQQVLDNTQLNPEVSASVGGVLVPVADSLNKNGFVPYSVKTYNRGYSDWFIMLTVDNYTHTIVSGTYKVTINGTEISSSNIFQVVNGINYLFYNGTGIPASQTLNTGGFVLQGEVVLDDGKTYILNVTLSRDPSDIDRILKQAVFKGSAAFAPVEKPVDPEIPLTPVNPGAFIPSGFGMKNIGVADYLKVEQSLQGYVEGEVAHIENVMARERREKSTKKTSRSEITSMESSDTEKEQLRDTSSTDRFELQSEISKALQDIKDANISAYVNGHNTYPSGSINYGVAGGFSTHNSKEENTRQAMTQAKEITQKATDRVVTKVHKERTEKMIEEFEESNIHEFDNRKGDKHVVGVYRWVDKVYKNQIYNYGKRMMFEFMIPEPAKLHSLGMKISKNAENMLIKPVDPRTSSINKMENYMALDGTSGDVILKYWSGVYNVEVDSIPAGKIYLSKGFSYGKDLVPEGASNSNTSAVGLQKDLEIPEGYVTTEYTINYGGKQYTGALLNVSIGDKKVITDSSAPGNFNTSGYLVGITNLLPISISTDRFYSFEANVTITCELNREGKIKYLQKVFNKIIAAYEKAKTQYEQDLAAIQAQGVQIKGSNPGFYRQIENTILRRNCISYMINQDPSAALTFGKNKYYKTDSAEESFLNTEVKLDSTLDSYTAFVKFMEQAFEWEIMSYYFYPYYWGNRNNWDKMYQFDDNDPTFRAFMQSGMARVIVTVRPGFEEAVRHYLATGQIWNTGEVPVIDDPLFLSIVEEMRKTEGEKYGKAWATRLPTALTILQAQSIGLNVTKALPFDDNLSDYEDPTKVPQSSQIVPVDAQMGGGETQTFGNLRGFIEGAGGKTAKIVLKREDGSTYTFTFSNVEGDWLIERIPVGKYELNIDANNVFPETQFAVDGYKNSEVVISENSTTDVFIALHKL
ncbi:carboxypeptidase regulatory-like domain-containing protein [Chryseobacterium bernardetii]|uniref:Carboxypeptidase regulatory-like domain-containing protein n=2 Tax=Chryseobacterium bernardetii TaxID=1241978 RepID=A0A3G6T519_9FLAO|nr:carboxypeptidase regulatory-like domain-containing protein [Chryseobacterium bernardetii]